MTSSEVVYAVHTRTCTYLLDEEGICRWIVSPTGMVPPDVRRCVGAQFVACIDQTGLVGELRIGAQALFVRRDDESGRMMLLKTRAIDNVENRRDADPLEQEVDQPQNWARTVPRPIPRQPPVPEAQLPSYEDEDEPDVQEADDEEEIDMLTSSDFLPAQEITVTLTMPLFRPEAQPPRPPEPPTSWRPPPRPRRR